MLVLLLLRVRLLLLPVPQWMCQLLPLLMYIDSTTFKQQLTTVTY
jgi:hypothetical protein